MMRTLQLVPLLLLAACGGAETATSFASSSPASTSAPDGQRVPVATVLDAADPAEAARSPLLAAPTPPDPERPAPSDPPPAPAHPARTASFNSMPRSIPT